MNKNLFWHVSCNFGDALSPYILAKILEVEPDEIKFVPHDSDEKKYIFTGSLLSCDNIKNATIFGAGFVFSNNYFTANNVVIKGVRGNKTLDKIKDAQKKYGNKNVIIDENVIVGEPSLLLPYFYFPSVVPKYKLGILPHWVDYERTVELYGNEKDVLVINLIQQPEENLIQCIERVISQMLQCEKTISSSLHGLIVSAAYSIPTDWCEFSKGKIIGDNFKFYDFLESIDYIVDNGEYIKPLDIVEEKISVSDLLKKHRQFLNVKILANKIYNSEFIKNLK